MTAPTQLGEFEQVVLLAILRLKDDAYGAAVRAEIADCTDREPAAGALYTTLDRLEDKGLVSSRFGDPSPQRGGRAKRYFQVTASGLDAVARAQRSYRRLLRGVVLPISSKPGSSLRWRRSSPVVASATCGRSGRSPSSQPSPSSGGRSWCSF